MSRTWRTTDELARAGVQVRRCTCERCQDGRKHNGRKRREQAERDLRDVSHGMD